MYSIIGRKTIAIRRLYKGTIIHTYDNVHRYPPLSDFFVNFGFTKGPPLLHSIQPNTFMHGKNLTVNDTINIGDSLTYDFSIFDFHAIYYQHI